MSGHTPLPATPIDLPLLPLRDVVVFPHMVIPLFVGRPKSIKALEAAMESERRIMLVAQKAAAKDDPLVTDMFDVGCVSTISVFSLKVFTCDRSWVFRLNMTIAKMYNRISI